MNEEIAKAVSTPLKIALFIIIGVACYYILPNELQQWLISKAEWGYHLIKGK